MCAAGAVPLIFDFFGVAVVHSISTVFADVVVVVAATPADGTTISGAAIVAETPAVFFTMPFTAVIAAEVPTARFQAVSAYHPPIDFYDVIDVDEFIAVFAPCVLTVPAVLADVVAIGNLIAAIWVVVLQNAAAAGAGQDFMFTCGHSYLSFLPV
jgi:hypothetical protein